MLQHGARAGSAPHGAEGVRDARRHRVSSNYIPAVNARATRELQARIHAAQPGTRLVELGSREVLLAGRQPPARPGSTGSAPSTAWTPSSSARSRTPSRRPTSISTARPSLRAARAPTSGATFRQGWWKPAPARRCGAARPGRRGRWGASTSPATRGVSTTMRNSDARDDMVPTLVSHLTEDFRPSTVRQKVK